jgi:thioredoxin-like negative regulator of GroEL
LRAERRAAILGHVTNLLAYLRSWLTIRHLASLYLGGALLGWGAVKGVEAWWYRAELSRAERALASRQYDEARQRLERLSARWPGRAEVNYPLGCCEAALGRIEAALVAWGRVPHDSAMGLRAALDRGRLALEHGRLAVAEQSLAPVLHERGMLGEQAARLADQIDLYTGRRGAISRRIERRWPMSSDQAGLLRLHWQLDSQPSPVLAVRETLDRMARQAPEDDRVWLGRAQLAIDSGRKDDADQFLKKCEARRPDDPDVLQAQLTWALDAGRSDEAARAATRLPASHVPPADVAVVIARLAALGGDTLAERAALERRVELEPGDTAAWDRLAELAVRDGSADHAAGYRRRKAEINRARDHYDTLMGRSTAGSRPPEVELGRLAEVLGRRFEARGWWSIRARQDPDDREAQAALDRLARPQSLAAVTIAAGTVADLIPGPLLTARPRGARGLAPEVIAPAFRDDAQKTGLHFVYENDPTPLCRLPETMGGGIGLLDYDGDGWLDVYAVQGGMLSNETAPVASAQGDRLFRNRGGFFEDVTSSSGLAAMPGGYGHGVAVGDYDNDGRADLFITRWRAYALYHNRGDGTFEDATLQAELGGDRDWPMSAAFADLDGDGDLDLYVCHYTDWDSQRSAPCPHPNHPDRHAYCVPRGLGSRPDHVFRNDGGRFVDVSNSAGVRGADRDGRGLGVVIANLDDDSRPDIYVANDMTANFLFRNLGGFRFEETGEVSGAACSGAGGYQAGMGIACGDLDGDGRLDLAVTNFYGESTSFFQNLGAGQFVDHTAAIGLTAPTRYLLGFGAFFLDADNDGRLDLAQANGHVIDYSPAMPYAMPARLWLGTAGGRLVDVSGSAGACWQVPRRGRGLAVGDLDNDGRLDLLIVAEREPLAYFHNQGPAGHFVTIRLEGSAPRSNRDAVGARVAVTAAGRRQVAQRIGGGSYLSACDGRIHFGLGEATHIEMIEVRWPSGHVDRFTDLAADAAYLLREGRIPASPLPGWRQ